MPIKIQHRFDERLLPTLNVYEIDILIIGTFNPGAPNRDLLNETELLQFAQIEQADIYIANNAILNFYDRPNNRFWKVMDIIDTPNFYNYNHKLINPNGLKYYQNRMIREDVFQRQKEFCNKKKIFITDIIKEISPQTFNGIYLNYQDTILDRSNCVFNTPDIIHLIRMFKPKYVLVPFKNNYQTIPNISHQIDLINEVHHVTRILSPSGSAGNSYADLLADWRRYIR